MEEKQFRGKITWFSFAFSLLVIWIHAYNAELYLGRTTEMMTVYRLEHALGDGLGQIAVPGFFMISGYLFYRDFTWEKLGSKWQRRIRSVLVPYILWNFLYYLGYVVGSRLPWVRDVVGKDIIPFTLPAAVDAVINYTYNYVFWYLFQLILLILLAPVLYLVLRRTWSRALFLAVLWILAACQVLLPLVNLDALIYYSTAASFALAGRPWVERTNGQKKERVCALLIGLVCLAVAAAAYGCGLRRAAFAPLILCRLLAVAGLWIAVPASALPEPREYACHNFFLYAVHFAFVRFVNKAFVQVLPATMAAPFLLYLAMPALALAFCLAVSTALRRVLPLLWTLLNGGRS